VTFVGHVRIVKTYKLLEQPHSTCKVSPEDIICFQDSNGIKGKESEEALGRYRRVGINKDMEIRRKGYIVRSIRKKNRSQLNIEESKW
jgi:hypothetical protein